MHVREAMYISPNPSSMITTSKPTCTGSRFLFQSKLKNWHLIKFEQNLIQFG